MSDIPKGVKRKKRNPIFICADVLVEVFRFLAPRQLGLGIAFVSDRFDRLVDGHFRTRQWVLSGDFEFYGKIGENGKKEMEIVEWVNHSWKSVTMPDEKIPLPANVIGFRSIEISFIDSNVVAFLRQIRRLFDICGTNLHIDYIGDDDIQRMRILAIIWPLISGNICGLNVNPFHLKYLRRFAPAILSDCQKLKTIDWLGLPEFPAVDSANASDSQAVAKWLCTPRGDGIPKVLQHVLFTSYEYSKLDEHKRAFINSSSPVNFIIGILPVEADNAIVPFDLINKMTGERLAMKRFNKRKWLLVRCPILRNEKQWDKWEEEAIEWEWNDKWNKIVICIHDEDIGDGVLDSVDATGPSGQQSQK